MQEVWKDIKDYEGLYQVSNFGNIRRIMFINNIIKKPKITNMKLNKGTNGYTIVVLRKGNKPTTKTVHRIVANAFIDNSNKYKQVNHKDGNKQNNHVDNLEWCNNSYNLIHAYKLGLRTASALNKYGDKNPKSKKVNMFDKQGNFIKQFGSLIQASKFINVKGSSQIVMCCKGRVKTAKGYIWKYAEV